MDVPPIFAAIPPFFPNPPIAPMATGPLDDSFVGDSETFFHRVKRARGDRLQPCYQGCVHAMPCHDTHQDLERILIITQWSMVMPLSPLHSWEPALRPIGWSLIKVRPVDC